MPKISVIIPVYNQIEKFFHTLDSLSKQTFQDFEIIVIDDGSELPVPIDEKKYLLFRQKNSGAPTARNKGFELSKGEYVIFWDADIIAKPRMLEKMLNTLETNKDKSYTYSDFYFGKKLFKGIKFDAQELKKKNYITTTSMMRRGDFPGFDETLKKFQDWDLWLTMLEKNKTGIYIPEVLFKIQTGGTMSSWVPSFAYKKPWCYMPWWKKSIRKYQEAKEILFKKHKIKSL